jgi:hypothetical protein
MLGELLHPPAIRRRRDAAAFFGGHRAAPGRTTAAHESASHPATSWAGPVSSDAMAQRSSRSKKSRGRSAGTNKPELRTSKARNRSGEEEAAPARDKRERREPDGRPVIKVRPEGRSGLLILTLGAWLVALLPLVGGWLLGQWGAFSYPDSLWLYVALAMVVSAVPVAWVARRPGDVDFWIVQAALVSLGALAAEIVFGPECPPNANCGVIGARGAWGIAGSIVALVVLVVVARLLGQAIHRYKDERRPRTGRATARKAFLTMVGVGVLAGVPLGITLVAIDAFARDEPARARDAEQLVGSYCFGLDERVPELAVRPDPVGKQPAWTSVLVRRANEDRKGIKDHPMPKDLLNAKAPTPYEAAVSFNADGDTASLVCRRVSPGDGAADANDFAPANYGATESTLDDPPSQFGTADNGGLVDPKAATPPGGAAPTATVG